MTRIAVAFVACLAAAPFLISCRGTNSLERSFLEPAAAARLEEDDATTLKAHMRDGRVYVFQDWTVDDASRQIRGVAVEADAARVEQPAAEVEIPLDSIALIETNRVANNPAIAPLAVVTAASVGLTVMCLTNTKACFGSCPTFYADTGDGEALMAEGFSSAVAPVLEARDVDALYLARPSATRFHVRVRNEALETHVIRHARLLAVPRAPGGRVLADAVGNYWHANTPQAPAACAGPEGDCLAALRDRDGFERRSAADSIDLATRETVELTFTDLTEGEYGVVLAMRQSLLSTYLFYQALAFMGQHAVGWLAALERADATRLEQIDGIGRLLGNVQVLVRDSAGEWVSKGEVGETGPLATDTWVVPIGAVQPGMLEVRLRLAKGHWRIDEAAIARLSGKAEPMPIDPASVQREGVFDSEALDALTDPDRTLVTLPGDEYLLSYRLPDEYDDYELFLDTRGYYLEWMREEWLREENPARAATFLLDPARTLRELAPEYKRLEASLDSVFWRSRYVRQ